MGRQGAANQLGGAKALLVHGQPRYIEDGLEIAIAMHQAGPCALKIPFRQLCFDQQPSQLEVHFRSICSAILQGDSGSETKLRLKPRLNPQEGTHSPPAQDARVTKNIHQQGV